MEPTAEKNVLKSDTGVSVEAIDQDKTMPMVIYILFLVSLLTGGLLSIVGVIIAYVKKGGASSDINNNHYRYLIRTFWIGCLYGLVGMLTVYFMIGVLIVLFTLVWYI